MIKKISDWFKHFFHVVSNIRPLVWISLYVALMPIFAVIYDVLPDSQFRIPDGAGTDFGSWLYYSIVTITTLGFGDYTPAHGWAQAVTAIEVMCGLVFLGFFLNAVGSMKSEIDIESELEKQRRVHARMESDKFRKNIPLLLHRLNTYIDYCREVMKPGATKARGERLVSGALHTSLFLDSLQTKVDLTLWPKVLEDSFAFVANYQMFEGQDVPDSWPHNDKEAAEAQYATGRSFYNFVKETSRLAEDLETEATKFAATQQSDTSQSNA